MCDRLVSALSASKCLAKLRLGILEAPEKSANREFIEWTGEIQTYELLLERQEALQGAHVN
jgi:hypothetical protein